MKRATYSWLSLLLLVLLCACGSKQTAVTGADSPVYLDESSYQGDQLEMIQLINHRMQYINEADLAEYRKLFHPNSPVYPDSNYDLASFPRYKITKVDLLTDIQVTEQSSIFQGVVQVEEHVIGEENTLNFTYVFMKGKQPDDEWLFIDVD